ncbi:sigma-70 family RNA polymerase sigma factor [Microbacterium cremeum]|uniref:sigma-70 family RNA polymerase sigma factor n=1 Tax=Microbacterium cremeum TaxID=2782169 RepID=UPI0018895E4B|nr:sigma-70 family RNA polymerase sigma factor [Microbacterium cremeum]
MDHDEAREPIGFADADLVLRSRSGDRGAFGELWRRHYRAGVTVARNLTSSLDPDDLVQEAYTRIYQSILTGRGPTGSFRAYLFTSIRNTAATWGRAQRDAPYEALEGVEDPAAEEHVSEAALDRGLTHQAFRSLPTRWQEVLWYSEIEQMKPAEIAPLLGMKPTAVAQLTFRAREGLREAWIQAHLRTVADGSDCQWTIEHLGAHTRRNLGRRDQAKVDRHLADCVRCTIVASEAKEVSGRLALVLLPLALGATGAAGYLATLQGASAPLVALAAMPSGVVQGAVTVIPTVTKGAAAGAGATGAATTGSGVAGAGAASGTGAASLGAGASAASASAGATASVGATASAGATAATVGASAATATAAAGVTGSALAGIGAASGIAASLVVVGGVVAAAVVLPAAAPEPVKTESTSISDTVPLTPGLLSSKGDRPALLDAGPRPADIPVIPESTVAASGDAPPTDGSAAAASAGGQTVTEAPAGDASAAPTDGGGTPVTSTPESPGHGSPSHGTGAPPHGAGNGNGNGNGGVTGNDGVTGNGTPTNGTGNGNGGVPGNGNPNNGTPNYGTGNPDNGSGTGTATGTGGKSPRGAAPKGENTPMGLGAPGLATATAATSAVSAAGEHGRPFSSEATASADAESATDSA